MGENLFVQFSKETLQQTIVESMRKCLVEGHNSRPNQWRNFSTVYHQKYIRKMKRNFQQKPGRISMGLDAISIFKRWCFLLKQSLQIKFAED